MVREITYIPQRKFSERRQRARVLGCSVNCFDVRISQVISVARFALEDSDSRIVDLEAREVNCFDVRLSQVISVARFAREDSDSTTVDPEAREVDTAPVARSHC